MKRLSIKNTFQKSTFYIWAVLWLIPAQILCAVYVLSQQHILWMFDYTIHILVWFVSLFLNAGLLMIALSKFSSASKQSDGE